MKIFIDTAKIDEIQEALEWGIIDGVTTNPSHIAATGRRFLEVVEEICALVKGPISVEVTAEDLEGMMKEARELSKMGDNIVIKVPLIKEGVKAIKAMTDEGIKTNATLNFSAAQALLAAKAGASYISPFVGRLDDIGHFGMDLVEQIKTIYDNYGYDTEIIVAATRTPQHVLESALVGADIVTMRLDIIDKLFKHPMTDIGLEAFLKDWEKVQK